MARRSGYMHFGLEPRADGASCNGRSTVPESAAGRQRTRKCGPGQRLPIPEPPHSGLPLRKEQLPTGGSPEGREEECRELPHHLLEFSSLGETAPIHESPPLLLLCVVA